MARGLMALLALVLAVASITVFACGDKVKDGGKDDPGQPITQPKI